MKHILSLLLIAFSLSAKADEVVIRKNLIQRYPDIQINQIIQAPVSGLYEVWAMGKLMYVDENADHIIDGMVVDTHTKTNLTAKRLEELEAVLFDALPFEKAIKIVKGKGERRLAIFSDPDCPYCKQQEKELAKLDNLTVFVFMFPLKEVHPQAVARAEAIWCSGDKSQAWGSHMLEDKDPLPGKKCKNPVADLVELGNKLGVGGTPTLIFPSGIRKSGVYSAAGIEHFLDGGS